MREMAKALGKYEHEDRWNPREAMTMSETEYSRPIRESLAEQPSS